MNAMKIPKDIKTLLLKVTEMQDMQLLMATERQTLMKSPLCKNIKLKISINYKKIGVWEGRKG